MTEFERMAANQNIDPEYVKMVGGVSEELFGAQCLKCKAWDMVATSSGKHSGICEECFNKNYVNFKNKYEVE